MVKALTNSIFKNLIILIHGPILLLSSNDANLTFKELENINPFIGLLSFKLNNKIYSKEQIKNCQKLSYLTNVSNFHTSLKTITRMPYYKIKSKKNLPLSK
jgi:plasmid rolling circle replication initiator protein Rep